MPAPLFYAETTILAGFYQFCPFLHMHLSLDICNFHDAASNLYYYLKNYYKFFESPGVVSHILKVTSMYGRSTVYVLSTYLLFDAHPRVKHLRELYHNI